MLAIRLNNPETLAEYETIIAIYNQALPDNAATAAEWQHYDREWSSKYLFQRFIVEYDGGFIAEGAIFEPFWMHVPGKYVYAYTTLPAYEALTVDGESVHDAIYAFVLDYLAPHKPQSLFGFAREDKLTMVNWLLANGFQPKMRYPVSRLDVQNFDPSPFEAVRAQVAASGIDLMTLTELQAQDPAWKTKTHALYNEIEMDIPAPDPPTPEPMEEFEKTFKSPNFIADGWLIAVDKTQTDDDAVGPYVGITMLGIKLATPEKMGTWITGVTRSYRRRGIALALKVASIEFARRQGVKFIETDNEENNPMYQINMKLGFEPLPAWADYEKTLG